MKTTDGGLHWQQISPDLTGAEPRRGRQVGRSDDERQCHAARLRCGVQHRALAGAGEEIWAGTDTGLLHLTRDGGQSWENVTPPGLSPWSKIAMIEASRFNPAVAYVAVDRHRLDDQKPYIYRTRDYGKTWQPIANGIAGNSFVNAIREDTEVKGLLYAGTELGIYVSFNDGDHWQPLQLNLPVTSVRDITIHQDDLIIATHGRSFWILDDITPLRQMSSQSRGTPRLFKPATAVRIDNDVFLGSPLPPEEPVAKNPPDGAIIDYYLPSPAKTVTLEIFDSSGKLVRRSASRTEEGTAASADGDCGALDSEAGCAGEHGWCSSFCVGHSLGQLRRKRRDAKTTRAIGAPRGPRAEPGQLSTETDGRRQHTDATFEAHHGSALASHFG